MELKLSIYNFKKTVRENILEFDISKLDADNRLYHEQRAYLSDPIQITPSGPLVQLYKDGEFWLEE